MSRLKLGALLVGVTGLLIVLVRVVSGPTESARVGRVFLRGDNDAVKVAFREGVLTTRGTWYDIDSNVTRNEDYFPYIILSATAFYVDPVTTRTYHVSVKYDSAKDDGETTLCAVDNKAVSLSLHFSRPGDFGIFYDTGIELEDLERLKVVLSRLATACRWAAWDDPAERLQKQ